MTFFEFCEKYNLELISKGEDREIEGGFAGDLHSWAMANAHENFAWFTIMGNINTVAVASLNDVAGVVLCQNSPMNQQALEKAQEEGINLAKTKLPIFDIAAMLYNELNR